MKTYLDLPPSSRYTSRHGEEPTRPPTFRARALDLVREMLANRRESAVELTEKALRETAARAREKEAELLDSVVEKLKKDKLPDPYFRLLAEMAGGLRDRARADREGRREDLFQEEMRS